jgi:hypothetical protein
MNAALGGSVANLHGRNQKLVRMRRLKPSEKLPGAARNLTERLMRKKPLQVGIVRLEALHNAIDSTSRNVSNLRRLLLWHFHARLPIVFCPFAARHTSRET